MKSSTIYIILGIIILIAAFIFVSMRNNDSDIDDGAAGGITEWNFCTAEDRAGDVCTLEYNPVCGYSNDSEIGQTYGNACAACQNDSVEGWTTGECSN